jgi:hypothetical protein
VVRGKRLGKVQEVDSTLSSPVQSAVPDDEQPSLPESEQAAFRKLLVSFFEKSLPGLNTDLVSKERHLFCFVLFCVFTFFCKGDELSSRRSVRRNCERMEQLFRSASHFGRRQFVGENQADRCADQSVDCQIKVVVFFFFCVGAVAGLFFKEGRERFGQVAPQTGESADSHRAARRGVQRLCKAAENAKVVH